MRFPLAAWRRPPFDDSGAVVPVGGIALLLSMGLVFLHDAFDLELPVAIALAVLGVGGLSGLAWALGHPLWRPGEVSLSEGELRLDLGRGRPVAVPVRAVRRILLQGPQGQPYETLMLEIEGHGWRRIQIARLDLKDGAGQLDPLLAELRTQIAVYGDLEALDRASEGRANQIAWVMAVGTLVGGVLTLWSMVESC